MGLTASHQLQASASFASIPSAGADTTVRGYPDIEVGEDQYDAANSAPESPALPLPLQVASLGSLDATMSYSVSAAPDTAYDWAYDLWFEPSSAPPASPYAGAVEVMVWTDHAGANTPPGHVGTVDVPATIDGVPECAAWSLYMATSGSGGHPTAWFVLDDPVSAGTVTLDLAQFASALDAAIPASGLAAWQGIDLGSYWLHTIDLGSEFGPQPGGDGGASLSWLLSDYTLSTTP